METAESKQLILEALQLINDAWTQNRPEDIQAFVDEDIVMVSPGFSGRAQGVKAFIASYVDFCQNAHVHGFRSINPEVDVLGNTAVASYSFEILYEREGRRWYGTGRDLWVFEQESDTWVAVWRTMIDLQEKPA